MSTDAQITRIQVLEQLLRTTREGFWFIDNDTLTLDVNSAMCDLLGREREDIIGHPIYDFVDEENADIFRRQIAARAKGESGPYEVSLLQPDGTNIPCVNNASPIYNEAGEKIASIGLWTNISDIKAVQDDLKRAYDEMEQRIDDQTRQLRDSEVQYRAIVEDQTEFISRTRPDTHIITFANDAYSRCFGKTRDELIGTSFMSHIPDEEQRELVHSMLNTLSYDNPVVRMEHEALVADGSVQWHEWTNRAICDADRKVVEIQAVGRNISERRLAEEQLRQAQKMEAIGQLTGGVAHDFNNLLMIIQVSTELIDVDTGRDNKSKKDKVLRAVKRGSELTDRLLAFSRRQPLRPETINIADLVNNMSELLSRTLGETIHIRAQADLGLWTAAADPGQVENALLNLAINARDAMPDGGQLSIDCTNWVENVSGANKELVAGDYVVLSVTDQGKGMSRETQNHAFEPFFTTKEVGQGSGLGLSMVYGFAKQSGGHVGIYSEEGHGTTIRLYLPRGSEPSLPEIAAEKDEIVHGQEEVILVVEDDADVQQLTAEMLISLNYQVVLARRASEAQEILHNGHNIDLVLSDIILPGGMSGWELAERQRELDPSLRFIFMSGYPADAPNGRQLLNPNEILISKPFRRIDLAKILRSALA